MSINESLKKTIDDLDLDRRVEDLNRLAKKTLEDAKAQASALAADNRGKVDDWVAKATEAVDARTDGKYHDKMQKFSVAVGNAVDKVAERGPGRSSPADSAFDDAANAGMPGTAFAPEFPPADARQDATDPAGSVDDSRAEAPASAADATDREGLGWPEGDGRVG
ncbi:MAG: hypothetical protein LCH77_02630 [Actinobacteria bacterium]|uniref:Antitoxin n=1 Tax=Nostocoides veronense TaxID=330836 RepID=A0ABN2LB58_9MICO|nr:hypothetical protein [Actinomycetota bacterium]